MFSRICAISLASAVAFLPIAAGAQTPSTRDVMVAPSSLTTASLVARPIMLPQDPVPSQQRRRDSLLNGVLVGVGIGAMVGAVGGLALSDCSECSGFNAPLAFGALGAGVGAGIGAGIDALHHEQRTIGGMPGRTRRLSVWPLLGKDVQAMVAWIRF